jgi:nucleoside-diphosphate-sugar epimerase
LKIAVTGASGFIGTELLAVLNKRDDVSVIALTRDASGHEDSERCEWRSTGYSFEGLVSALEGADIIIHLAGVRGTENDPVKFLVNEVMTDRIVQAMWRCHAKRIVFASTMSVYNDDSQMPWTEDAPLKGRSCYGDSKANCERTIREYAEKHDITYGIARIAQVLGEGEKRRGMMNVFLDTARDHGTIKVMGKSVLKKQYVYVKDLVKVLAILALGNEQYSADSNIIVNVGMPHPYSNLEVAQIVNEVYGNPVPIDYDDSYPEKGRPFHMDISRLRNELGYEPMDMKTAVAALSGGK